MKISMMLLARFLEPYSPIVSIERDELTITGIRLLSDQRSSLSESFVYLAQGNQYFTDERYGRGCILANGHSRIICPDCDREELLNDVLAAFEFYGSFSHRLADLAASHAPGSLMLEEAAAVAGAPAFLFDDEGRLVASALGKAEVHPLVRDAMRRILGEGCITAASMSEGAYDRAGRLVRDLSFRPQTLWKKGSELYIVISYVRSASDGVPAGYCAFLGVDDGQEVLRRQVEELLLEYLPWCRELTEAASVHQPNVSIARRLLAGEDVAGDVERKFLEATGLAYPLVLMEVHSANIDNYAYRISLSRAFGDSSSTLFSVEFDDSVFVWCRRDDADRVVQLVFRHAGSEAVSIGVSLPFFDLAHTGTAREQVRFALESGGGPGVHPCERFALGYLLNTLRDACDVASMLHPAIGLLADYDQRTGSDLLATLSAYLRCERNQVATAAALHIHRNTCKYRIARIAEIAGIDFEDPDQRDYLMLSLRLGVAQPNDGASARA